MMSIASDRLPPGQQLVARDKWPVIGEPAPSRDSDPWQLSIDGLCRRPQRWDIDRLRVMPRERIAVDIHCVTRWSKLGVEFGGVRLAALLELAGVLPQAGFVWFAARSNRRHDTSLPLADACRLGALVAVECQGEPLAECHGGPLRLVVPGRYFYKSLKWLSRIELLAADRLGFWERTAGYHNGADPWQEQRYMAGGLSKPMALALLAGRNVAGKELLGLLAAGRDLTRLDARGALLRNADFAGARLPGACFEGANLSNARFCGADLREASFRGADVEGADFAGADLRGADFSGASLVAATFQRPSRPATIDRTTRFDPAGLEGLTPLELAYVRRALALAAEGR